MRTEPSIELEQYRDDPGTGWRKMGGTNRESGEDVLTVVPTREMPVVYRVYKRRWFGLGMLMLLNIVISWGVSNSTFSNTAY